MRLGAFGRRARGSGFLRSFLTLLTGTALSQAIPIVASPILTRMYGPAEFGIFGLYYSILLVASVVAMGSYELAILLPADDADARRVAWLATGIAGAVSLVGVVVALVWSRQLAALVGAPSLAPWLLLLPANIFLTSLYQVCSGWVVRRQHFRQLSMSRVSQSGVSVVVSLVLGLAGYTSAGLIAGLFVATTVTVLVLGWQVYRDDPAAWRACRTGLSGVLHRYREFPQFSLPATLVNTVANQLPTFLFSRLFGAAVTGLYSFTNRILNLPVTLLATSVRDVFRQRASADFAREGNCRAVYLRTMAVLAALAIGPALVLLLFGPVLFALVFGEEWRTAGEYARILAVLLFFRFIASPLSHVFIVADGQRLNLVWQVGLAVVSVVTLVVGATTGGVTGALLAYSIGFSAMYALNLAMSYRLACGIARPTVATREVEL